MNILVTGANGQLGNEMRKVSIFSSTNNYFFTDIAELDITNIDAIRKIVDQKKIGIVINCAAYTNVDKAEDDVYANLLNNKAVENIAVVCKEYNILFIHISTDYVFKGDSYLPYTEEFPTDPLGVYGLTKLEGEKRIIKVGCKSIIIRTSWLYSVYGNNFVKTMKKLTSERDSLNVVFDQIGTPTNARDLACLIYKIIEDKLDENNCGIYHFSNEGVCSWYDFAREIAELCGNVCDINPCHSYEFPSKAQRPHYSVLDKTKVKETFNIIIPHWKDSLKKCLVELSN